MTQEKILQYLKAELEWAMRQKPYRECCSDDEEYNTECIAWDTVNLLLERIIDRIKHYDDEDENMKLFINTFIKMMKE